MSLELGPWEPLALDDVVDLLAGAPFRWWIAGGHALELHQGRSWRDHADTDVGIARSDAAGLREVLHGWQVAVAAAGVLEEWDGHPLDPDRHENNLWCRRRPDGPWELDVLVGEGDAHQWIYRRDPDVRLPWDAALLSSTAGVPYLAPEVQLLFKSRALRRKDHVDAEVVIPTLRADRAVWLATQLDPGHPWQALLSAG